MPDDNALEMEDDAVIYRCWFQPNEEVNGPTAENQLGCTLKCTKRPGVWPVVVSHHGLVGWVVASGRGGSLSETFAQVVPASGRAMASHHGLVGWAAAPGRGGSLS